jgi:hypothetical protein
LGNRLNGIEKSTGSSPVGSTILDVEQQLKHSLREKLPKRE